MLTSRQGNCNKQANEWTSEQDNDIDTCLDSLFLVSLFLVSLSANN